MISLSLCMHLGVANALLVASDNGERNLLQYLKRHGLIVEVQCSADQNLSVRVFYELLTLNHEASCEGIVLALQLNNVREI